ncbi:MAG: sigma-70 family RNA polymerase sigma factor [Bacteroidales bacterium]|nr:sigma-70 family RNA polymerase sigma factor [Bacteroidales bacterium]
MEEKLLKLLNEKDKLAHKMVYEHYATAMFRLCFRYLKNEQDSEDVLIAGFMKIFDNYKKFEFRGKGSFDGWVKRIMINESLMFLRRSHNFNMIPETYSNQIEDEIMTDANISAEEIFNLVRALPIGYRTVFNLYAVEGFSHKDIAERLGISENTSKSQLSKARAALVRLMKENKMYPELTRMAGGNN